VSTQRRLQSLPEAPDVGEERSREATGADQQPKAREARVIRRKRIELGFFIRRRVDGRLKYLLQIPPAKRRFELPEGDEKSPGQETPEANRQQGGSEEVQPQTIALALTSAPGGGVQEQSNSAGTDDSGPIHSTSYEIGFYCSITTTESGSDDS